MKRQSIKRGRPKLEKPLKDQGTPELQRKRQDMLESLNYKNFSVATCHKALNPAIFDGCYLQQLFFQDLLTQEQLEAGLFIRKIYALYLRSRAIKNKLSFSFKSKELSQTDKNDFFEDQIIEEKWKFIILFLQSEIKELFNRQALLKILLNDFFGEKQYSILNLNDNFLKILRESLSKLAYLKFSFNSNHITNSLH